MAWQRPRALLPAARRAVQALQPLQSLQPPSSSLLRHSPSLPNPHSHRTFATETETQSESAPPAAPEIDFSNFASRPARVVPASPSYFTGRPKFNDSLLELERLLAKYESIPTVVTSAAPRMAWMRLDQFRQHLGEQVPATRFREMLRTLQRLNRIDPALAPHEVRAKLVDFLRPGNPFAHQGAPMKVDELGRSRAKGRRKASTAVVQMVEGEGEFMVNGQSLMEVFNRLHDRESATWPLRCVQRLDKYNVWATVKGGGVTGQAEAITLAVARALAAQEPALKSLLRKGMSCLPVFLSSANLFQLASLRWTADGSRERSRVFSRRARRPNGSRGECPVQYVFNCTLFNRAVFIMSAILCFSTEIRAQSNQVHPRFASKAIYKQQTSSPNGKLHSPTQGCDSS